MPGGGWVTTHEDITEQRNAEEEIREQQLKFDAALQNMSQGLCMYDGEGRVIICNQRYLQMYALSETTCGPAARCGTCCSCAGTAACSRSRRSTMRCR